MKVFVFDTSRCNGCYCCQIACKDEHCGNDWTPYARPQPDTGQFWLRLSEHVRGTVPKVKVHYVPSLCNHCDEPACLAACPVDGGIYKRDDGLVLIDPQKCDGCSKCADACRYGAIFMNEALGLAQKCTGCAHLLDAGWKEPRCVDACPTLALTFQEEEEARDPIAQAEVRHPEYGQRPRVYYLNVPRRFVAGTVYDPVRKEVVTGATCSLTGSGASPAETGRRETDGFGDFWFEGLEEGTYSLEIRADGFASRTFEGLTTAKDVNLGDIPLDRVDAMG
jgi:tetrathionate reductase subunit B